MTDRVYFQTDKNDKQFIEGMQKQFTNEVFVNDIKSFSDPLTFITLGISITALTIQAIDFIANHIVNNKNAANQPTRNQYPKCIIGPSGRIELTDYSAEEVKSLIETIIKEHRD